MAEIDHLVHAVPDLVAACDRFERDLGVRPVLGGRHPGMGTWNALLALRADGMAPSYLELIAPDPDRPDPGVARPFGLDDDAGPRLVTFAVRTSGDETIEALISTMRDHGHDPGEAVPMSRATPLGDELHWRLTFPTLAADGWIPFLIDWGDTPNPALTTEPQATLGFVGGTPPAEARPVIAALRPAGLDVGSVTPGPLTAHLTVGERTIRL